LKEDPSVFKPYKVTSGLFAGITLPSVTKALPRKKSAPVDKRGPQERLNQSIPKAGAEGIWLTNNPAFFTPYKNLRKPSHDPESQKALGIPAKRRRGASR
jgi:hypothetical protein